ncbi:MAG: hypothetical protein ACP5HQ_06275 [Thermoprotei archaeon]
MPNSLDDLENARKLAERSCAEINCKFPVVVPIYQELLGFPKSVAEVPMVREIAALADKVLSEDFTGEAPRTVGPTVIELDEVIADTNVVLIVGHVGTGMLKLVSDLVKRVISDRKIVLVSTNPRLEERLRREKIDDFVPIRISQKFKDERFKAKNFDEIIRISKKLSTEILNELNGVEMPPIIVYRTLASTTTALGL